MHIYVFMYVYIILCILAGLEYVGIGTAGLVGEEQLPAGTPPSPHPCQRSRRPMVDT